LLVSTRPAFGGNILADIKCPDFRPQMATVRANVFKKAITRLGQMAKIISEPIPVPATAGKVRVISKHFDEVTELEKLDEAEVVIAGGRGMKDTAGFEVLDALATELGGAVGASRAAIDMGLQPKEKQIGQSGVNIAAKLYVAAGISGAVQHTVGVEHSDVIIGINKDANAPIFNLCKYSFVGDARTLLPKVLDGIRKAKKK
jgi:electron transfer flavoprotein alpha subunit